MEILELVHLIGSLMDLKRSGTITMRKLTIGQGTYSSVYKAHELVNDKLIALKKVRFEKMDPESIKFMGREIVILRRLDHPNIIKLEGLVISRTSCSLYLVFEYMEHDLTGLAALSRIKFIELQDLDYSAAGNNADVESIASDAESIASDMESVATDV
ncbi:putative serine/threonine-protein kinase [Capsicum baccatum]|uniref:Serine/threonine-protein kinase n=1 Tax=Capsicum baccatum TaxID=33114 RepID=A0A2G2V0Z8_CAPBA|nr:putative serine/threonine-protein kinase [Capsicum baccatum]